MFQLERKGAEAFISDFEQLMVSMTWSGNQKNVDFDLFAVYENKNGSLGLVYYANQGDLNAFPFIKISDDASGDDADNEETLVIVNLDEMKSVWLCCWDYKKVEQGQAGRLVELAPKISIMDDKGNNFEVPLVNEVNGNCALIAKIDNSSPISIKLLNASRSTILPGLVGQEDALMRFLKG
jgi:uncharacterized protein involved in tellurium resistance